MKRLHQNCNHAFNVFNELDCLNWEKKNTKKGYFENSNYIEKLLDQRIMKYKEEKAKKKYFKTTIKKKKKIKKMVNLNQKTKENTKKLKKDESVNFYFGEEIRNDQLILKPDQSKFLGTILFIFRPTRLYRNNRKQNRK